MVVIQIILRGAFGQAGDRVSVVAVCTTNLGIQGRVENRRIIR
jgi:hypothetical protein